MIPSDEPQIRRLYPSEWRKVCASTGIEDTPENRNRFFIDVNGRLGEVVMTSLAKLRAQPKPISELIRDLHNEVSRTISRIESLPEPEFRERILKMTQDIFDAGDLNQNP